MSKINIVHDKFLRAIIGSVIKVSALTDEQIISATDVLLDFVCKIRSRLSSEK